MFSCGKLSLEPSLPSWPVSSPAALSYNSFRRSFSRITEEARIASPSLQVLRWLHTLHWAPCPLFHILLMPSDSDLGIHCPHCKARGPPRSRLGDKGVSSHLPNLGWRKGSLRKQHGQCISGGHSGPRMEAKSKGKQGQGYTAGSQEQPRTQEQQQQSLLEAESS